MTKVTKRDGRTVDFDFSKVETAINKALVSSEATESTKQHLLETLKEKLSTKESWTVEEIQDAVEVALMEQGFLETAKQYIKYRFERSRIRDGKSTLMSTVNSFFVEQFNEESSNKENANINATSNSGTFYRIGSEASKAYYSAYTLPPEIKEAFDNGYIYYHDRDYYGLSLNCMQHDLLKMFKKGFSTGNTYITEPQSVASAMALTCVILQSGQTDLFGGESIPAWDYYMEPYVEKSFKKHFTKHLGRFQVSSNREHAKWLKEYSYQEHCPVFSNDALYRAYSWAKQDTEEEANQAAQAMVHNLNSLACRAGKY